MPSFSAFNFRKGRKPTSRAPIAPIPVKPASPASFYSPGSPLLEIGPHLPFPTSGEKDAFDESPNEPPIIVKPPRPPRIHTPELSLDLSFNIPFSVSELFLARNASGMLDEMVSEGAAHELYDYNLLKPATRPSHHASASQTSIVSSAASVKSTHSRRPAPAPIQIPNPTFLPTAKMVAENPADVNRPKSRMPIKGTMASMTPSLPHATPRQSMKRLSSAHSSSVLPDFLSSMFVLSSERTSDSYGHARQDSAILPVDTPGHRIPSLYRKSRSIKGKSVARRTSMPLLNPSPIAYEPEMKTRPVSAISPSPSPLDALRTTRSDEALAGRPQSKPLPGLPDETFLSGSSGKGFVVEVHATDTSYGETSGNSTGLDLSSSAASTAPTSASLYDGLSSARMPEAAGKLKQTLERSASMDDLREMAFSASELKDQLDTVPEVSTPSTDNTRSQRQSGLLSPRVISSFEARRRSMDGSSKAGSVKSKSGGIPHLVLPIGISSPITRQRASISSIATPAEINKEKSSPCPHYGQIPPSAILAYAAPNKSQLKPRLLPPALSITETASDVKAPVRSLRRKTHGRNASTSSSGDFPSPPLILGTAPKRDTSAFPQTPKAWSSVESSPQQPPRPLPPTSDFLLPDDGQHALQRADSSVRDTGSRRTSIVGTTRKPTRSRPALPIGPRKPPSRVLSHATPLHSPGLPPSALKSSSSKTFVARPRTRSRPQTPTFGTQSLPWRGLTLEAAQWMYTSDQLHEIVGRAIRAGNDTSSIRLLNPDTLDIDLPEEEERLESKRDQLKNKFRSNSRRRRLLLAELAHPADLASVQKIAAALQEENAIADQFADELYTVSDQLAQLNRLREAHSSSALTMALRKLNSSLIRTKAESLELQTKAGYLEAERDEAWATAERVEQQLDDIKQQVEEMMQPKGGLGVEGDTLSRSASARSSRVSAVRKASLRASKASLRLSHGRAKSVRSSSSSVRYTSIIWPNSPTNTQTEDVPPVPRVPQNPTPLVMPTCDSQVSSSSGSRGTSATSISYVQAKREVYELLGLEPVQTPRPLRRTQSMSEVQSPSPPNSGFLTAPITESPAESIVGPLPSPLVKSWSVDFKTRPRRSFSVNGTTLVYPQRLQDVLEDPESMSVQPTAQLSSTPETSTTM